jgi:DNA topoisomerase-2
MKVSQLASSVAYETQYHHGEVGIGGVICGLAQEYTGSNNLNWLEPIGQFGSRLSPIPAAHRYIFTKLSKNFRKYFKKEDDIILNYLYDDGYKIEPDFFIPILPGILLNSSQGIGTGFASLILSRNPVDITKYIENNISGKKKKVDLLPYFSGFKGTVSRVEANKYSIVGCFERKSATQLKITEIPVGMYLGDIKKHLNKLLESGYIKDYEDNSEEGFFDIDVFFQRGILSDLSDENIITKLKLSTTVTENLTCWLPTGKLKKFDSVEAIIDYFIEWRLGKYTERIDTLIKLIEEDIGDYIEKIRFLYFYLENVEKFRNASKLELITILDENKFDDKLLDMKIWNLTGEKIQELELKVEEFKLRRKELITTVSSELYLKELGAI